MGDQDVIPMITENISEIEIHKVSEEKHVHFKPTCCSCDPICVLSRQSKHKSESEDRSKSGRKLCGLIVFCIIFILIEIVGGIKANSLAVLADAAHLLTDVAGFTVSLFTVWASGWEATPTHSFGFFRVEVLGALFSVQLIWLISGILIYEAIDRIVNRTVMVKGKLMFFTAVFGVIINLMMVKWLGHDHTHHSCGSEDNHHQNHDHHRDHNHESEDPDERIKEEEMNLISSSADEHRNEIEHHLEVHNKNWISFLIKELKQKHVNMNLQGAYLHILGDLIQSIGVMIGGAIIWAKPNWLIIDLFCTLVFTVLVLFTTVGMLRNIFTIFLESAPKSINVAELEADLLSTNGVHSVHDLHVWSMSVGKVLLSCHVIAEQGSNSKEILLNIRDFCEQTYGIHHVTVQIEE